MYVCSLMIFSLSRGLEVVTHMLQFKMLLQWLPFNQSFSEWLMTPGGVLCKCRLNRVCSCRRILTCPTPSTDSQSLSHLNESDLLHEKNILGARSPPIQTYVNQEKQ